LLFLVADQWRARNDGLVAPNLARLAREGVTYTRAYTAFPVCCPARAAMLTGKYPHQAGVTGNHQLLPPGERTMSAEFKRAGYRTGYIGKWHLDGHDTPGFVPPERRRGFDYWAANNLVHKHYDWTYFRDTPEPVNVSGFAPDYQTDLALDFIRQPGAQPYFLYVSWVAPHPPLTPPPRHATYDPAKFPGDSAAYYGLCSAVDENVGRLLDAVDDNTIVVFTSDHGWTLGAHGVDAIDEPYEDCVRIPLLIRYPRRSKAGTRNEALFSNIDFAPLLTSLCGVPWPVHLRRREEIYSEARLGQPGEWRLIVRGHQKLVVDSRGTPTHFYDLRRDPHESNNLARSAPKDLLARLLTFARQRTY
jgi:arylsulfatase A-like enzyme